MRDSLIEKIDRITDAAAFWWHMSVAVGLIAFGVWACYTGW